MNVSRRLIMLTATAAMFLPSASVLAADINVLSAGAAKAAVSDLAAAFEKQTGNRVNATYDTVGGVLKRMAAGEPGELIIVTSEAAADLDRNGKLVPGSRADLGKVQIGVAVKEGTPLPDISTPEAFKKTLLAAKSLVYVDPAKGATSGIHFAGVLKQLGIDEQMKPKTTLLPGGFVVEKVASGEIEIGVHQITEIVPVKGAKLVGPIPAELQKITVYTGGLARNSAEAKAFLDYLVSPVGRARFAAGGFAAPD